MSDSAPFFTHSGGKEITGPAPAHGSTTARRAGRTLAFILGAILAYFAIVIVVFHIARLLRA